MGADTISITEELSAPIAKEARVAIEMGSGKEAFVFRTIGYSTSILALAQIFLYLAKKRFNRVQLIILDGMSYVPFNKNGSELLFQLISDWYKAKSITLNLEFSSWNKVFIDPCLT